jgi:hypothetical protein
MRAAAVGLALLLTGCQSLRQKASDYFHEPNQLITVHAMEPVGAADLGRFQRQVTVDKQSFTLRRIPLLSSTTIVAADAVDTRIGWGLRLYVDRHGEFLWTQAATEYHGRRLAVLVDGIYRGNFAAASYPGVGPILLPLQLTRSEAELIASQAKLNYETMKRD